jgi:uncharacterized membrane protein YkgB
VNLDPGDRPTSFDKDPRMNSIFYLIGIVVVILAVLSLLGLR